MVNEVYDPELQRMVALPIASHIMPVIETVTWSYITIVAVFGVILATVLDSPAIGISGVIAALVSGIVVKFALIFTIYGDVGSRWK